MANVSEAQRETHVGSSEYTDNGSDELGSQVLQDIRGHDRSGHGRGSDLSVVAVPFSSAGSRRRIQKRQTYGRDDVGFDVVLDTLLGHGHGKSDQTGCRNSSIVTFMPVHDLSFRFRRLTLASRVVDLSEVTIETRSRRSVDHSSVLDPE